MHVCECACVCTYMLVCVCVCVCAAVFTVREYVYVHIHTLVVYTISKHAHAHFILVFFYVRDVIDIKFLRVIALSFTLQLPRAREPRGARSSPGERNENHVGPTRSTEKEALELQGDVRSSFATGKKSSKGR